MSDVDSAEIALGGSKFTEAVSKDLSELLDAQFPRSRAAERDREGLPPGYRMRAEAHYVDELMSRSTRTSAADEAVPPAAEDHHARLVEHLAEAIATIGSAAALLTPDGSSMAHRIALDLVKAEAWRAAWQLRATAILGGAYRWRLRSSSIAPLVVRACEGIAPEARLKGFEVTPHIADWGVSAPVDDQAMVCAITAALVATLGLTEGTPGRPIKVSAVSAGRDVLGIEVTQTAVGAPAGMDRSFFEAGASNRPGGWLAAIAAGTLKAVAERHGGRAAFLQEKGAGTTIRFTLKA